MPTPMGGSRGAVARAGLSGALAGRLDAIGGHAILRRLLHGLATDTVRVRHLVEIG